MFSYLNKLFLITGASSGIGKAVALYLLEHTGAHLVVLSRNQEKLQSIYGPYAERCQIIGYDLTDLEHIENIFLTITGKLDGMVHCAGVSPLMKVVENDVNTMLTTFQTNYYSFIELCKFFHQEKWSNTGASIVAMSSIAASVSSFRQTVYSSSKAALEQSIKCIAKEFLDRSIRVNAIAAGAVETEMFQELENKSEGLKDKFLSYYPLGMISPLTIAKSIVYLLSEESAHIDGSVIRIDSGFLINQ